MTLGAIVKLTIKHDEVLANGVLHKIPSLITIERLKIDSQLENLILRNNEAITD